MEQTQKALALTALVLRVAFAQCHLQRRLLFGRHDVATSAKQQQHGNGVTRMAAIMGRWHASTLLNSIMLWARHRKFSTIQMTQYHRGVSHLSSMVGRWKHMALIGVVRVWVLHRHLDVMLSTNLVVISVISNSFDSC